MKPYALTQRLVSGPNEDAATSSQVPRTSIAASSILGLE